jgi:hypothetical protein
VLSGRVKKPGNSRYAKDICTYCKKSKSQSHTIIKNKAS